MKKDLVLYLIAMVIASIFIHFFIIEARDGMIWKLTVIAEDVEDTWYNFVTHGLNPLLLMCLWVGIGSLLAFLLHLMFDNGEES